MRVHGPIRRYLEQDREELWPEGHGRCRKLETLVESNKPDITSADDFIQPGQKLRIPAKNGIVHRVLTGETLGELADDYGVAISAILGGGSNASGALTIGDDVLITDPAHLPPVHPAPLTPPAIPTPQGNPTDTPTPDTAAATATATPQAAAPGAATATPAGSATAVKTGTPAPPTKSKSGFIWPTTGPISSYFGPSHPLGIDIDLYANPNAPIVAAAARHGDVRRRQHLLLLRPLRHRRPRQRLATLYAHIPRSA